MTGPCPPPDALACAGWGEVIEERKCASCFFCFFRETFFAANCGSFGGLDGISTSSASW